MIIQMAIKNLFRYPTRTFLTLLSIIVGITLAQLGEGINYGMRYQLINNYIYSDTGFNKIYRKGYYADIEENIALDFLFKIDDNFNEFLDRYDNSKRIKFTGDLVYLENEHPITILGVDPDSENRVFKRDKFTIMGDFLNRSGIVLGEGVANKLKINLGESLTLIGRTSRDSINAIDYKLIGIIKTGNFLMDNRVGFVSLRDARTFTLTDKYNDIVIMKDNIELTDELKKKYEMINWTKEAEDVLLLTSFRRKMFFIVTLLILIMAALGISNTMLMAIMERRSEIGVLKAMGFSNREVLKLFLYESILIGIIGSTLGITFGFILVKYYEIVGIPILEAQGEIDLPLSDRIYLKVNYIYLIFSFFFGIIIAIISSVYPAYKASKEQPTKLLRRE